jgi:hypothetical protein
MKKIYILTCINEKKQLVAIKAFKSEKEAREEMKGEYEAEKFDAEQSGYDNINGHCGGRYASITYGDESEYMWEVSEVFDPVAEDAAMDSMKQEFIERAYFDAKATIEDDSPQKLSKAVGTYDSFYFDEETETIQVWDNEAKNYTSIFNMPTDAAYEVAKQIYAGDYEQEQ